MTMAVSLEASTPAVTCSAVEREPKPLLPDKPVNSQKIEIGSIALFFPSAPSS